MSLRNRIIALLGGDTAAMIGAGLSVVWLLLVLLFWLLGPDAMPGTASGLMWLATIISLLLPLVLIWMAVGLARAITGLRAEADDLRLRLGTMRETATTRPTANPAQVARAAPAQPRLAAQPARPAAASTPPRATPADQRQTAMSFESPNPVSVDPDDLIRALNFPEGPDDRETIAALRAALRDHEYSRVIRAAQDVVTLLGENGLYMDHLAPGKPNPAIWRRFAEGLRGAQVQAMGAIHDDNAEDLTLTMLKSDEIFRDSAHHFLRHFDLMLTRIGGQLSDEQLVRLADTRSARAFMLVGRSANVFG